MFALDIRGHLNSLRLAESKALWPLFEAVVNSIQSIEDSPNRDNGKITIFAQREDQDPNLTIQKDVLERFESFVIEDNGNGSCSFFNPSNCLASLPSVDLGAACDFFVSTMLSDSISVNISIMLF